MIYCEYFTANFSHEWRHLANKHKSFSNNSYSNFVEHKTIVPGCDNWIFIEYYASLSDESARRPIGRGNWHFHYYAPSTPPTRRKPTLAWGPPGRDQLCQILTRSVQGEVEASPLQQCYTHWHAVIRRANTPNVRLALCSLLRSFSSERYIFFYKCISVGLVVSS